MTLRPLTPSETALAAPLVADLRYVVGGWQFRHYVKRYADFDDAVSQAYLGVHRAAISYDPAKGKFTTYAYWFIRHWLQKGMPKFGASISHRVKVIQEPFVPSGDGNAEGVFSMMADTRIDGKGLRAVDAQDSNSVAMQNLSECQRGYLRRVFAEGDTCNGIARSDGMTRETARRRVRIALDMARCQAAGPEKGELFA